MRESIPNSPKGREHILNSYLMAPFLVSMAQSGINWRPCPSVHGKEAGKAPQGSHRNRNKQWLLSLVPAAVRENTNPGLLSGKLGR